MTSQPSSSGKDFLISPKYRVSDWTNLKNLSDPSSLEWLNAVEIFCDRIYGRFLAPIEMLENHPDKNIRNFCGFTVIAIDCLLIETMYQFIMGVDETDINHIKAFWKFFSSSRHFRSEFTKKQSRIFYTHFRCGILHQAQTKMSSKIRIGKNHMVQYVDPNNTYQGLIIDRKRFHSALKQEMEDYAEKIRRSQTSQDFNLRDKFKMKMDFITGVNTSSKKRFNFNHKRQVHRRFRKT